MSYIKKIVLFFILFLTSCIQDKKEQTIAEIEESDILNNTGESKYRKMAFDAIYTGDTISYLKASKWFRLSRYPERFLYFSNIMALKYNYAEAYHDIYILHFHNYFHLNTTFNKNDTIMINYLLYNLAKSYEHGFKFRQELIGKDTITQEKIMSSDYYLNKTFPPAGSL